MLNFNTIFGHSDIPSIQIPPKMLANEFGEVSIRLVGNQLQVAASLAMGAFVLDGNAERCCAGLALDASQSMRDHYGRGRRLTPDDSARFLREGKIERIVRDGVPITRLTREAKEEAERLGLGKATPNVVQDPAIQIVENMIRTFATGGVKEGACEVIYWACGEDGKGIECVSNVTMGNLPGVRLDGPKTVVFGPQTHLAPPFRYFAEKTRQLSGVFVFLTDGHIDDEAEVVRLTHQVAGEMNRKERCSIKCVLLGVGNQVDIEQFGRIDDMEMPEELTHCDIWNSKIFTDMRDISDAWSEIFDPEIEIASTAVVYDDKKRVVYQATDSVKALLTFSMPFDSKFFDVVIEGDMRIHQPLPCSQS